MCLCANGGVRRRPVPAFILKTRTRQSWPAG
jgi:hypothetical protein